MCPSMGLTVSREHTCLHAEKCSCLRAREDIFFFQAEECMRYIGVTGVQTCALPISGGIVGVGLDELQWPRPVRPGDELRLESEVLDVRPSKARPSQGLIKVRTTTLNQYDEPVQIGRASCRERV